VRETFTSLDEGGLWLGYWAPARSIDSFEGCRILIKAGGTRAPAGVEQWSENQDKTKQPEIRVASTLEHCLCDLTIDLNEFYTVTLVLVRLTKFMKVRFSEGKMR
jgi:hypothetical protein